MKGFNLATVGGSMGSQPGLTSSTPSLAGSSMAPVLGNTCSRASMQTLNETNVLATVVGSGSQHSKGNPLLRSPITKLAQLARLAGAKKADSKKKWGNLIEAAKSAKGVGRMWTRSRSRSEDSVSSDGSGGTAAATDDPANSNRHRAEKYSTKSSRTGYPVVHVTENELPEVLEESGIDYELSGRMGMDSVTNTHSPIASLRRFRRACSEPVDQVTLILEDEEALPVQKKMAEYTASNPESYPCSVVNLSTNRFNPLASESTTGGSGVSLRFRRCVESATGISAGPIKSRDWMAGQNLPDNQILPFMDESAEHMNTSPRTAETVFKSFNGVTTTHDTTPTDSSDDPIYGIQPLGNNPSGGWL